MLFEGCEEIILAAIFWLMALATLLPAIALLFANRTRLGNSLLGISVVGTGGVLAYLGSGWLAFFQIIVLGSGLATLISMSRKNINSASVLEEKKAEFSLLIPGVVAGGIALPLFLWIAINTTWTGSAPTNGESHLLRNFFQEHLVSLALVVVIFFIGAVGIWQLNDHPEEE